MDTTQTFKGLLYNQRHCNNNSYHGRNEAIISYGIPEPWYIKYIEEICKIEI